MLYSTILYLLRTVHVKIVDNSSLYVDYSTFMSNFFCTFALEIKSYTPKTPYREKSIYSVIQVACLPVA